MKDEPQREQVYLPWHFRDRLEPTRTYCGRVVYDRPKHLFGMGDVERIVSKITVSPSEKEFIRFARVLKFIWDLGVIFLPFLTDPFSRAINYVIWAYENAGRQMADSGEAVIARTKQAILEMAAAIGLKVTFSK